ncbi:hmg-CoA reductase [Boeremia exigua]|uniref:hmg-CoA reductase n=1 Tax=Boeremia exigua TaxID=749465 RepID=UPI001E8DFAC8|nr:hmg-CoA reductase [Boeremia exigua]KAH6616396.1 hmg-CoA reductase [Boeremia exigua]
MAFPTQTPSNALHTILPTISKAYSKAESTPISNPTIENHAGFIRIPVGIAGPLLIHGPGNTHSTFFAPLATVEPTLVASCSRGSKAFTDSGGLHYRILHESMIRAPVFCFHTPAAALAFAAAVPGLHDTLARAAEATSRFAKLQRLVPCVVGADVHVRFEYSTGDAAGQNMVTIATQAACDSFLASHAARGYEIVDFFIEGDAASDKKASWRNVAEPRGCQVLAWGEVTNEVCERVLKCSTARLYKLLMLMKESQTRNGGFGCNVNTANVVAAMFVACGQDAGSVAESAWSQLSTTYDAQTKVLRQSLFFPSLPVGVVGGGTMYPSQKASLELLGCRGPGGKRRLAGLIACFCMALDISTAAAIASGGFTDAHKKLARDAADKSKL